MKYTLAAVIEADTLMDAWNKLHVAIPRDFRPDSTAVCIDAGLCSFTLAGGGREIHVDLRGLPAVNLPLVHEIGHAT